MPPLQARELGCAEGQAPPTVAEESSPADVRAGQLPEGDRTGARPPQPLPVRAPTKALLDYPNEMLHFGTYYVRKWRGPSGPTPSGAVLKHPNPAAQESAAEAQRQSRKEWLHRFTCLQNHQHISGVYNPLYALSFDAPTKSDSNPGSRAQKLYDLLVAALPSLWKGGFCGRRTSATRQHYDIDWAAWRAAQPAS